MSQAVHNYKDGRRGKFLRTSRRKDEKNFFHKWPMSRPRLQIFDSPAVKVYHIVAFFQFWLTKRSQYSDNMPTS